jgi:hypothetical protein
MRPGMTKLLEENTGEQLHDIELGDYFLDVTLKSTSNRSKVK